MRAYHPRVQVFNTLGRRKEELIPRRDGEIGIYACGATVQSAPHLGHGRMAVVFDVIRRYLEWRGFRVTFVTNITDIEDKIIAQANRRGITPAEVAEEATAQFLDGYRRLGVRDPDHMPRATDHVASMIDLVARLVAAGHAYAADGDVYFAVRSFPDYGKLSGRNLDDLLAGARVEPGEQKRDPLDFALWKAAKPGEPSWPSPWGPGRPGWHIECSVMAARYLGSGFDIHGGGQDLIFPHHENEIAQSEAVDGALFARYWLHNGLLNLSGEKMAKSTGLVVGLLDALERYPAVAVRLFYLRSRYREPFDFTEEGIEDAIAQLDRLWAFRRRAGDPTGSEPDPGTLTGFREAMDDDFNTAGALGVLFEAVRAGNRRLDAGEDAAAIAAAYDEVVAVLGIAEPAAGLGDLGEELVALGDRFGVPAGDGPEPVLEGLIARREAARSARDWATADAIRDALEAAGVVVEDTADGARWHRG